MLLTILFLRRKKYNDMVKLFFIIFEYTEKSWSQPQEKKCQDKKFRSRSEENKKEKIMHGLF